MAGAVLAMGNEMTSETKMTIDQVLAFLSAEADRANRQHADIADRAHSFVAAMAEENLRLRRALRQPTTETFAKDVAEYEAELAKQ